MPTALDQVIADLEARQRADDARRARERFSGAAFDAVTGDYRCWVDGEARGWAPTYGAAHSRAFGELRHKRLREAREAA